MANLLLIFPVVFYISAVTALSPYPIFFENPSVPQDASSEGYQCDAKCYKNSNRSPDSNITFVCGSDRVTYLNLEELECVRKSCGKDIRLWRNGRCPRQGRQDIDMNLLKYFSQMVRQPENGKQIQFSSLSPPIITSTTAASTNFAFDSPNHHESSKTLVCLPDECGCPEKFHPICGSDSVTYGNECLMECNKKCKPGKVYHKLLLQLDIVKFHDGHCGKLFFKKSCVPDECGCEDDLKPVCGSDFVTYGNKCLLECNRNCYPDVTYNHEGYCGKLFYPSSGESAGVGNASNAHLQNTN